MKSVLVLAAGLVQTVALALLLALPARASFQDCLGNLRSFTLGQGITPETFDRAARGLEFDPEVIALSQVQPEFKTPIWDYLAGLVDEERVADGKAAMAKWGQALASARQRFGVDPATVTAVWGVESNFGAAFGNRFVVRSLATLSCEGRRQAYFRSEFVAALKILQAGDIDPQDFKGSWAGAFGHTQFMPSTFLRIAVDGDGDGRRDLVKSVPDALASTANYLRKAGWQPGETWGFEVKLPAGYAGPAGRTKKLPMSTWAAKGITRVNGRALGDGTAGLLLPAGPQGPAFLVTKNFDAIYGYNAAESYALAISLLSDQLRGEPGLRTPWPTDDPGLSRVARRELQTRLIQRGYDLQGKIDGVIGDKTREAIADFQGKNGLKPDGRASVSVLEALRR